ncbi:MAG: DUF3189 family protein [Clostridiales bacterium]|jgi:hypothetical protein|nr:DUF3189 family protein [Clostridiales bacterium]
MKLFYHCFGGAHTSITCASIHLNFLPRDRIPKTYEFKAIPFYDKMENKELGKPVYMGQDDMGWDIYVIGMKDGKNVVIPAIKSYLNANYVSHPEALFVSALVQLHPITAIGGITSRRLGLPCIGRPMTVWGIRRSYPHLVDLVNRVKQNIAARYDYY